MFWMKVYSLFAHVSEKHILLGTLSVIWFLFRAILIYWRKWFLDSYDNYALANSYEDECLRKAKKVSWFLSEFEYPEYDDYLIFSKKYFSFKILLKTRAWAWVGDCSAWNDSGAAGEKIHNKKILFEYLLSSLHTRFYWATSNIP